MKKLRFNPDSRIRVDLCPKGIAKLTKTTIVKAVGRLLDGKQFVINGSPREFIEFISENIKCTWSMSEGVPVVDIEIKFAESSVGGKVRLEEDGIYYQKLDIKGWSLDMILSMIISGITTFVTDNRDRIDVFI